MMGFLTDENKYPVTSIWDIRFLAIVGDFPGNQLLAASTSGAGGRKWKGDGACAGVAHSMLTSLSIKMGIHSRNTTEFLSMLECLMILLPCFTRIAIGCWYNNSSLGPALSFSQGFPAASWLPYQL